MNGPKQQHGFSLIELMVVISIIGLLAAIGLPAMKGIGQSNAIEAASRQLADDLAFARQKAISTRSTVSVVFVPPNFFLAAGDWNAQLAKLSTAAQGDRAQLTNMIAGQYTSYALVAKRTIGDQPGKPIRRYLTEWKNLPEGIAIPRYKFNPIASNAWANFTNTRDIAQRPFAYSYEPVPIPTADSPIQVNLPYIAFDAQGKLVRQSYGSLFPDEVIPLTRASIFYPRDARGQMTFAEADFRETPPGNSTNTYRGVRINWMTGRAKIEKQEIVN